MDIIEGCIDSVIKRSIHLKTIKSIYEINEEKLEDEETIEINASNNTKTTALLDDNSDDKKTIPTETTKIRMVIELSKEKSDDEKSTETTWADL